LKINEITSQHGITIYKLSKISGVPYTTINDIYSGKTRIEKCNAETLYKMAKSLGVSIEELIEGSIKGDK